MVDVRRDDHAVRVGDALAYPSGLVLDLLIAHRHGSPLDRRHRPWFLHPGDPEGPRFGLRLGRQRARKPGQDDAAKLLGLAVSSVARAWRGVLDVREPEAIDALARELEAAHGGADIVFSDATPHEPGAAPLDLALTRPADARFYGELVRFGNVLPWDAEIAAQARVAARVSLSR